MQEGGSKVGFGEPKALVGEAERPRHGTFSGRAQNSRGDLFVMDGRAAGEVRELEEVEGGSPLMDESLEARLRL